MSHSPLPYAAAGLAAGFLACLLYTKSKSQPIVEAKPDNTAALIAEVAALKAEKKRLEVKLETAAAEVASYPPPALVTHRSMSADGTVIHLSPSEVSDLRRIFDLFDSDRSGTFDAKELQALHQRLGEPITAEEASTAITSMTASGHTSVSFDEFVKYWNREFVAAEAGSEADKKTADRYRARFQFMKAKIANPEVANFFTAPSGAFPSFEYRVKYFYGDLGVPVSPWHNVPYKNPDGSYNFICEIPKWTRRKMEISTGEPFNPIKQDVKNGKLREYAWGDMMFNYGAFPQTWESPEHITEGTGKPGDNDPLDAIEIGNKQWSTGSIVAVKVLGVLALIDSGETDWKVLTISVEDPMARKLNDVEDVEAHLPGLISGLREWLRLYKSGAGIVNEFGYEEKCMPRAFAEAVVEETHVMWEGLVQAKGPAAVV